MRRPKSRVEYFRPTKHVKGLNENSFDILKYRKASVTVSESRKGIRVVVSSHK